MTKDEYGDFVLRYKGCGACFPMYHTLSRFEKMWFSAIQKDVAELEKENAELRNKLEHRNCLDCSNHSSKLRMKTLDLYGSADDVYGKEDYKQGFKDGAEYGYNKAKEEMQAQDYSLFDFVMQYENGKFKCKYKSGKEFESVDGETWKEIVLPELKESE